MTTSGARFGLFLVAAMVTVSAAFGRAGAQSAATADSVRGRHIATALAGCADCHGASFAGGRAFVRGGITVFAANLTGGAGGVGTLSDAVLRQAIRAGVRPDGTRLMVMPVREYAALTDADLDDLIAFLRSLPPVDHVIARASAPPSTTPASAPVEPGSASSSAALTGGAYLATIGGCTNCHGANLAGTVRPGGMLAPNISHAGIGSWSFAEFQTAMRSGKTPDGRILSTVMPWRSIGGMTDAELRSVYDFLEAQPARAN